MAARAVIHLPARVAAGQAFEVRATVAHAMETGYRNDDAGNRLAREHSHNRARLPRLAGQHHGVGLCITVPQLR